MSQFALGARAFEYLPKSFPRITGIRWFNLGVLVITPALSLYGLFQAPILMRTVVWTALYYIFSMLGKLEAALVLILCTDTDATKVSLLVSYK